MSTDPAQPPPESQPEPTLLDLYKSVTRDWRSFFTFIGSLWDARGRAEINRALEEESARQVQAAEPEAAPAALQRAPGFFPWRSILALLLGLYAQLSLEPPGRNSGLGIPLYIFAAALLLWAFLRNEWHLPAPPPARHVPDPLSVRFLPLFISVILALIAFWDFGEEKFTAVNVTLWVSGLVLLIYGLWLRTGEQPAALVRKHQRAFWVALILVVGISIFYRFNLINAVPAEPFSDHAEKILDVYDITQGQTSIFFPRNTGREAFQMYWTLLVAKLFGTGLSFLSLKLGTVLLGLLTLPYLYLLGREFGGVRAGLFALFLFGIGYWPNLISRIGLRFPLYPLFAAPTLYYLVHGLRTRSRNDFILCGLFVGLGLHGYSPFRIVPLLVAAGFGLYWLHAGSRGARQPAPVLWGPAPRERRGQAAWWLAITIVVSLIVFLPLLRYSLNHADVFSYRAFSRLGNIEAPLPGPALEVFFSNLWRGLLMFNWDDGEIWVNSLPHRPALDVVTGALYLLGIILLVARYLRERDWRDLFLLLSIPALLLPSVLSLAFPGENPALNRAAAAAVPAMLVSALALDGFLSAFPFQPPTQAGSTQGLGLLIKRAIIPWAITLSLLAASLYQNYDLVFRQFDQNFRAGAWNTSEMGRLISEFRAEYDRTDTLWIVPYPHWVDTRLPGVWAGIPNRDFALWPENFAATLDSPFPKLFLFNMEDVETEKALRELYPDGELSRYTSATPGKDFMMYFVER